MLNYTWPSNNSSPCQSTTPSAFVFARIALPYARNCNTESIGDGRPLYAMIVMNCYTISRTLSKWLRARRRVSASLSPVACRRHRISCSRARLALYNTSIRATVTTADNTNVYINALRYPCSGWIPNTANPLYNAFWYSLSPTS